MAKSRIVVVVESSITTQAMTPTVEKPLLAQGKVSEEVDVYLILPKMFPTNLRLLAFH